MIEFQLGGREYRMDKLNAIQQFHVSRKIAPLIPPLIPVFLQIAKSVEAGKGITKGGVIGALTDEQKLGALGPLLQPFADGMANLPDATVDYLFETCLSVVRRRKENNWAPIWSSQHKTLMFDDMDLGSLMPLIVRVITENLGPFIFGLLTSQQGTSESAAAT